MTDAEIKAIADRVLGPVLGRHGLDHIEIRVDHDDPEAPALLVHAYMKPEASVLSGSLSLAALHALSEELLKAGELRFPHLRLRYPDEEQPAADVPGLQ